MYAKMPRSPTSVSPVLVPVPERRCKLLPVSASLAVGRGERGDTAVSSTLSGFTSPWTTAQECRYASPPATSASS